MLEDCSYRVMDHNTVLVEGTSLDHHQQVQDSSLVVVRLDGFVDMVLTQQDNLEAMVRHS